MNVTIKKFKKYNGFTLVELIITIAVLSIGIIGVYNAFSSLIMLNYTLASRFTAAYLSQEGLEIIRNMRDNNFVNRLTWSAGLIGGVPPIDCTNGCQGDYKTGTLIQGAANQLKNYDSSVFLKINADGLYSYDTCQGCADTRFTRKIIITQPSGTDMLKVDVLVLWSYNGQSFTSEAEEYLYNWY